MIPYVPLVLSNRNCRVTKIGLPTETHGNHKVSLLDIKLTTLISAEEIDRMIGTDDEPRPSHYIFDGKAHNKLRLAGVNMECDVREKIEGVLSLELGNLKIQDEDAHTVGSVNRLTFKPGGTGELVLQFRIEASTDNMKVAKAAVEKGEAMLAFEESDESANTKHPENAQQTEIPA